MKFDLLATDTQSKARAGTITTDHGTINCKNPSKVIGDKNMTTNLRYKTGKSIEFNKKFSIFATSQNYVLEGTPEHPVIIINKNHIVKKTPNISTEGFV